MCGMQHDYNQSSVCLFRSSGYLRLVDYHLSDPVKLPACLSTRHGKTNDCLPLTSRLKTHSWRQITHYLITPYCPALSYILGNQERVLNSEILMETVFICYCLQAMIPELETTFGPSTSGRSKKELRLNSSTSRRGSIW